MVSLLLYILLAMTPFQDGTQKTAFDIRAKENLILGKGAKSGTTYYDVIITRQPTSGVLVKLPYTRKGGKFSFDLHHRIAMTPEFKEAEVTTIVEILTGGNNSIGTYTISSKIGPGDKFTEEIVKTAAADLDKAVTPLGTRAVAVDTRPGPQSLSIVGQTQIVTRGAQSTRIDTPNARIATISNLKFEELISKNPLKKP